MKYETDPAKQITRMRIYRSIDPQLPLHEWKLVADISVAQKFTDKLKDEPHVMHYYYACYVFADGHQGPPGKIMSAMPVEKVEDAALKQRPDLN